MPLRSSKSPSIKPEFTPEGGEGTPSAFAPFRIGKWTSHSLALRTFGVRAFGDPEHPEPHSGAKGGSLTTKRGLSKPATSPYPNGFTEHL